MAWASDSLLDEWKRKVGSPVLMRLGVAGFIWTMAWNVAFGGNGDPLGLLIFGFWLLAAGTLVVQVFARARISFWDQYRHPVAWSRLSFWLAWFPAKEDSPIEKVAAIAASSGAIATTATMFVSAF